MVRGRGLYGGWLGGLGPEKEKQYQNNTRTIEKQRKTIHKQRQTIRNNAKQSTNLKKQRETTPQSN